MTSIVLIPAKYTRTVVVPKEVADKLPDRLMMFSSVQFLNQLPQIRVQLEAMGKTIVMVKSSNFLYEGLISEKGQLLGCNSENFNAENHGNEFDAFLYIGDGVFHPQALLVNNRKDIYCYDPKINKVKVLEKEMHDTIQKRTKGNILKFLTAKNVGFIVTTKRGQNSSKRTEILREKILKKWPDKTVFVFLCNELNFMELENYNFIDAYINTACSRIGHDDTTRSPKPIVNISDVEDLIKAE
ncbi:MAG TPA: diphthamide synthesis protein [Alphaproteobacteria bacterium]|nr:diphthamide synthesis protein [Alphaproteobacteria bacterium]